MENSRSTNLEDALATTESDADAALATAMAAARALRRFRAAARVGSLRELKKSMNDAEQAVRALSQQFANAKTGWDFDEESYLENGAYPSELLAAAERIGVKIFEQDDRLYCYPSLIRILPSERCVEIDKVREKRLRPSVLASHLKNLQRRPPRFKAEPFLESLFVAYTVICDARGKGLSRTGAVVRLVEIYHLLTLLPGQSREYSRQEFGRDIYLLDQSGVTTTRAGRLVSFPASTGTKSSSRTLTVITQSGELKQYYGISFG